MNEQRINELLSDEAFVTSLAQMDTPEQVQAAFKAKGVEISKEELVEARDIMLSNINDEGELSLTALDDVAGGSVLLGLAVGKGTKLLLTAGTALLMGAVRGQVKQQLGLPTIGQAVRSIFSGW